LSVDPLVWGHRARKGPSNEVSAPQGNILRALEDVVQVNIAVTSRKGSLEDGGLTGDVNVECDTVEPDVLPDE
jgi:hypothetical protein